MGYKTYKFKLYDNRRRNGFLRRQIESFANPYNHLLAVRKRYYRIYGKSPSKNNLIKHIAKLKRTDRFGWWKLLPSQALQNVVERIEFGYDKFFKKQNKRSPKFRARFKYKSYTLKQSGYDFVGGNVVQLSFGVRGRVKRLFKFHKHREFDKKVFKRSL